MNVCYWEDVLINRDQVEGNSLKPAPPKGGVFVYIDLSARDMEIYNRYNGNNRDQLCKEYGLSVQRLYQIINAVRARELTRRQPDLYGQEDEN